MKSVLVVTLVMFFTLSAAAQVAHLKFVQDGETATLSESTASSFLNLSVSRNTTNSGTTANISYLSVSIDSTNTILTITEIIGAFTATDFTGVNTNNLALNFSTADLDPSAINLTCTLNLGTFVETCGAATPGTISLSWKPISTQSTEIVLGEVQTFGNLTIRTHQRSDNSGATATGTVFGTSAAGGSATVGINHSSTLEAIRTQ